MLEQALASHKQASLLARMTCFQVDDIFLPKKNILYVYETGFSALRASPFNKASPRHKHVFTLADMPVVLENEIYPRSIV